MDDLEQLLDGNKYLNLMTNALEDITQDAHLHKLPDIYKVIRKFKQGFNGTYKKIQQYDMMRKVMQTRTDELDINFEYSERRLYMYEFIKEPYSYRYPEEFKIRFVAHVLAHIELAYYIRQNKRELNNLYNQFKSKLGNKFIEPIK